MRSRQRLKKLHKLKVKQRKDDLFLREKTGNNPTRQGIPLLSAEGKMQ